MKKRLPLFSIIIIVLVACLTFSQFAHADVDWRTLNEINIGTRPLDVATAPEGEMIFILTPGEILVYERFENRITSRIPISKNFDRVTYSGRTGTLILTSSSSQVLKIVKVDRIHNIDISGLPFKGPENAPVTIAVFDDYQ